MPSPQSSGVLATNCTEYLTKSIRLNSAETLAKVWCNADKPHGKGVTPTGKTLSDPLVQTATKGELTNALSRLALAANPLLIVFGTRKLGHDNPAYGTP